MRMTLFDDANCAPLLRWRRDLRELQPTRILVARGATVPEDLNPERVVRRDAVTSVRRTSVERDAHYGEIGADHRGSDRDWDAIEHQVGLGRDDDVGETLVVVVWGEEDVAVAVLLDGRRKA